MRGGRGTVATACVLVALVLVAAGCGAEARVNDPRPLSPVRLSVTISEKAVTVQPTRIGLGANRDQQIPQNQHASQPPIKTKGPLNAVFVIANLTDTNSQLRIEGPKSFHSGPLYANSSGSYQVDLPTGLYALSAARVPGAKAAQLAVGPSRVSSQNEVLLP